MRSRTRWLFGLLCILEGATSGIITGTVSARFTFSLPELRLVEEGFESIPQSSVDIDFDTGGLLHCAWIDSRTTNLHIFGTFVQPNGTVKLPFRGLHGTESNNHSIPFITRNAADTSGMYLFGVETTVPNLIGCMARWDLTQLPNQVTVIDKAVTPLTPTALVRNQMDVIAVSDGIIYVMESDPNIVLRKYTPSSDTWDVTEFIISPFPDRMLVNPRLAKSTDDYLYLSYENYYIPASEHSLIVRQSLNPGDINYWKIETWLSVTTNGPYNADLAATGTGAVQGADRVALVFVDPNSTSTELVCWMSHAQDWSLDIWNGSQTTFSLSAPGTPILGPRAAFSSDDITLYTVWADGRTGGFDEIFGAVSYDGGSFFVPEQQLTSNESDILEPPVIATGTDPGQFAVAYIRSSGASSSPFVLASMPIFFDTCDGDPSRFWDSYAGISPASSPYHSPPQCYALVSESMKGALIRDFGTVEQTGSVDLYFYDDPSNNLTDFAVTLENNNEKGVIRMLGVRNETTPTNYAYSTDGFIWVDWTTAPRFVGWHHVSMTVNAFDGLAMTIEYSPGQTETVTDPTFTSFTRISIAGGDDMYPYYVDDIQVSAVPVEQQPIPATSTAALALLIVSLSYGMIRTIRRIR
ncbi:hypothetical protein JXA80_08020 [bacterium]|nr:hypothetical protein [candidate division CSSED10-310 bacterium]